MTFESILAVLNSPAVITFLAAALLYGLNQLYAAKPTWAKYEGSIISAIKAAEKAIPDTVENKGARRLDEALKFVLEVYRQTNQTIPSPAEISEIREGIQITHDKLEARGTLRK